MSLLYVLPPHLWKENPFGRLLPGLIPLACPLSTERCWVHIVGVMGTRSDPKASPFGCCD